MCAPFAADYDGDEMTLFIVKDRLSIKECESFGWPHGQSSPYKPDNNDLVMPRGNPGSREDRDLVYDQAICSTLCWSDRTGGARVNKCHERWLTIRLMQSSFLALFRMVHGTVAYGEPSPYAPPTVPRSVWWDGRMGSLSILYIVNI